MTLLFKISFDLSLLAILIFIVWFILRLKQAKHLHKSLCLSIMITIISVMFLSYGNIKSAENNSNLPSQNQAKISALQVKINHLEKHKTITKPHQKSHKNQHASTRITNNKVSSRVKNQIRKHPQQVSLVATIQTIHNQQLLVRRNHSHQNYQIIMNHRNPKLKKHTSVIIKGNAVKVVNNLIVIKNANVTLHN